MKLKEAKMKVLLALVLFLFVPLLCWGEVHSGVYHFSYDLSRQPAGQEVELWVPYPVSDANQSIKNISWKGNYAEAAVYTETENGVPMLYARWPEGSRKRTLEMTFSAERSEQRVTDLPEAGAWDPRDYRGYLGATSRGPIDGAVKALANDITEGKKGLLAKARAVYDWTVDHTFRDPNTRGCGLGDVPSLLKRPGGKCADISSMYVALARAAGVPSREVLGLRSGADKVTDVTGWQHCWAEFFLPGTGWVPVDPADVRKAMLKQNLKLDDPKVAELRDYFWGGVDARRIRLAEGRDLQLNPPQQGPPLNYLMYPFAQVGGQTIDWLDAKRFSYRLTWAPKS